MKFNIAAKLGLLAAAVSLVATGIVGWVFYGTASKVLTSQALQGLGDNTCRVGQVLSANIRQQRRDCWSLTQEDKKEAISYRLLQALRAEDGRPPLAPRQPETEGLLRDLVAAIHKVF